eukprot:893990_1
MHELDQQSSYRVMKAVEELKIATVSLSEAMKKKLSRKMTKQEIHYIRDLIKRAIQNTQETPPATTLLNRRHVATLEAETDALTGDMLRDIFDTYRVYKFSNFQFETYCKNQFIKAIEMNKFLEKKKEKKNMFSESYRNRAEFALYPSWLIADDQFIICNYFFCASYIVNKFRARVNPTRKHIQFSIYIIPKKIVSIYDENISFAGTLACDIAVFLKQNGFNIFSRTSIDESACDDPQTLYQIIMHYLNCQNHAYLSQDILLIIDRREA